MADFSDTPISVLRAAEKRTVDLIERMRAQGADIVVVRARRSLADIRAEIARRTGATADV